MMAIVASQKVNSKKTINSITNPVATNGCLIIILVIICTNLLLNDEIKEEEK